MAGFQHHNLSPGNIHGIANWVVSDIAARDILQVSERDLNKVCRVGISDLYWLSSVTPVMWSSMGGSSGGGSGGILDGGSRLEEGSIYDGGGRL